MNRFACFGVFICLSAITIHVFGLGGPELPIAKGDETESSVPGTLPASALGQDLPPYFATGIREDVGGGIGWRIGMAKLFTTFDSFWLESDVSNDADRRVEFEYKKLPTVYLTSEGMAPRQASLSDDVGIQKTRYNRSPLPGESMYFFRLDLKAYFGALPAGVYHIRFIWPAENFAIGGVDGVKPKDIHSPEWNFEVRATSVEAAAEAPPAAYRMITREAEPTRRGKNGSLIGVFTNTHRESRLIPFYPEFDQAGKPIPQHPPLHVPLDLYKWEMVGDLDIYLHQPQDLPLWPLKAGESVEILLLPDWRADGDGIYYYRLALYGSLANGQPHLMGEGFSDPFAVNQVVKVDKQ